MCKKWGKVGIFVETYLKVWRKGYLMFMGEYHPSLDEKGRVAIPAKLRKAFGDNAIINKLIITYGFDQCIMAFREEDWTEFVEKKLVPLPQSNPINRDIIRKLLGGACVCDLDKQGRMLIPGNLLNGAEISKDVTILGLYNRIEIWASKIYESHKPDQGAIDIFAEDLGF